MDKYINKINAPERALCLDLYLKLLLDKSADLASFYDLDMCRSQGIHWRKTACTHSGISCVSASLVREVMVMMMIRMVIPVVIVEDEDGNDAARAHHEHDAAKIHA